MYFSIILFSISIFFLSTITEARNPRDINNIPFLFARGTTNPTTPKERTMALGMVVENEFQGYLTAASQRSKAAQEVTRWKAFAYAWKPPDKNPGRARLRSFLQVHKGLGKSYKAVKDANERMREKAENVKRIGGVNRALQAHMKESTAMSLKTLPNPEDPKESPKGRKKAGKLPDSASGASLLRALMLPLTDPSGRSASNTQSQGKAGRDWAAVAKSSLGKASPSRKSQPETAGIDQGQNARQGEQAGKQLGDGASASQKSFRQGKQASQQASRGSASSKSRRQAVQVHREKSRSPSGLSSHSSMPSLTSE